MAGRTPSTSATNRATTAGGRQCSRARNSFWRQYVARADSRLSPWNVRVTSSCTGPTNGGVTCASSRATSPGHHTRVCYTGTRSGVLCCCDHVGQEAPVASLRVAIIGVGTWASSLVQGVHYYRHAPEDGFVPGLMHPRLGGYHVGDIEFSAAFDIDARKVGRDLAEAIGAAPNNTVRFAEVPPLGVPVQRGMTHDGLGTYLSQMVTKAPGPTADIAGILRDTGTHVVVNFLPVGSEMATK